MDNDEHKNGLILGGTDNGELCVISAAAILNNKPEEANVTTFSDHSGAVTALDINKFQSHIVASGGPDSEIFIWDLKNIGTPLTPGPKTTPPDQISCLAWNKQVQHILASSTQTGRVVVWDLRKSEPIIKVGDQSSMVYPSALFAGCSSVLPVMEVCFALMLKNLIISYFDVCYFCTLVPLQINCMAS